MTATPILGLEKADGTDVTRDYLKVELAGSLDTLDHAVLNPMTTPGDLIRGGTGGLPTRLGKGADGQVLAVVGGLLTWVTPAPAAPAAHHATHEPGGSDALTGYIAYDRIDAKGDLLVGTADNTVGRVALVPVDGWVLTANAAGSSGMAWAAPATGGMANPMTTLEDVIKAGASGVPTRLAVGAEGQLLGVSSGVVGWTAPPAVSNLLTNPGMEVWQRSAGPFTANLAYAADGWQINLGLGSTLSVSRNATFQDTGSTYCAACTYTHSGASGLAQTIEDYGQLRGRTVTLAVRVRTTAASCARLGVWDSVNTFRYGAFHSGSGAYETLTVTAPIAAAATGVQVHVQFNATATIYVDSAVLVVGSSAPPYVPLHPADEVTRCQRYYFEVGGLDPNEWLGVGQNVATTSGQLPMRYPVEMLAAPTVAVSAPGDWQVFNAGGGAVACTAVNPGLVTRRSCRFQYVVASGLVAGDAAVMRAASTTAARITFTASP